MLLTIDIGNTNITFGVFRGKKLIDNFRMRTKSEKTSDEYGIFIITCLREKGIEKEDIKDVIISSVVPDIMYSFEHGIRKFFGKPAMIVGPGIKTGISIHTDNPVEVGADRIVDAVAALEEYGGPIIVIDFGTATTIDYVSGKGIFEAAVTTPGIKISADALWKEAAKLPGIAIHKPDSILAKNTIHSMQAGLVYGYIGQIKYIVEEMQRELGFETKVIATGGLGRLVVDHLDIEYDQHLTLKGLYYIYERNNR